MCYEYPLQAVISASISGGMLIRLEASCFDIAAFGRHRERAVISRFVGSRVSEVGEPLLEPPGAGRGGLKKESAGQRRAAKVTIGEKPIAAVAVFEEDQLRITFDRPAVVQEGETLQVLCVG